MPGEERRNGTILILVTGIVALALLAAWTIILRREPIETDLTRRAEAALTAIGADTYQVAFNGRDGSATVDGPLEDAARLAVGTLEGVRAIDITTIPTTTTTVPPTTTTTVAPTTTTTTTTTTVPVPDPAFSMAPGADAGVVLSGTLHPDDALAVVEAAAAVFGADRVTDEIATDGAIDRPPWATALVDVIPALGLIGEPGLTIDGVTATVSGEVPSDDRGAETLAALDQLGLQTVNGLTLAGAPGQETAAELEAALNEALSEASVLFATGSADLSAEAQARLDEIARLLIAVPGARVEVEGHTDSEGPADGNLVLSQERADAVASYLVAAGVDPVQVTAVGYGETRPIAENTTPEGRAANRRIAFAVEGS